MTQAIESLEALQQEVDEEGDAPPHGVSYGYARRHGVMILEESGERIHVGCRSRCNPVVIAELRRHLGRPLTLEVLEESEFDRRLTETYEADTNHAFQAMEDLGDNLDLANVALELGEPEDLLESEDDAPIIRLINALFTEAIKENASDIHIEAFEKRLSIRMRVDGVLREVLTPPRALAPLLVSRIKVMAHLDIAEKRLPQDGRIALKVAGRAVDVRVSTMPSNYGERVVLRLLDKQAGRLDLVQLGMAPVTLETMNRLIHRPHGIILVTGPTGSGKTTTLYAALSRLNDRSRNIVTVEDPVEYDLDGISQTQVNTKVDLTFARGLRAILRQDPDIVMVGEIRDLETSQIAVQASLTGHLVLTTLHTNSAVGAVTRLRDMGVEPFLLSSSLEGVLAQRLVRVLCPHCKRRHQPSARDRAVLGIEEGREVRLYEPVGCEACHGTGFHGRTGIYELIEIDETLRTLIHDGAGEQEMLAHARTRSPGIREDGIRRVLEGTTTLEEVMRVTQET